jgi:hypothetical protein
MYLQGELFRLRWLECAGMDGRARFVCVGCWLELAYGSYCSDESNGSSERPGLFIGQQRSGAGGVLRQEDCWQPPMP